MSRRLLPLAALLALAVGCNRDKPGPAGDSGGGGGGGGNPDPGAAYTIQIREKQAGDKFRVTETVGSTRKMTVQAGGNTQTRDENQGGRFAYTEEVLEMPAGADRPTKVRRTYTTAEWTSGGNPIPASFQGKTVLIERRGSAYHFQIEGGGPIGGVEAGHFEREYNTRPKPRTQDLMPTRPVRVGESWELDKEKVTKQLAESDGTKLDLAKTTATGRLAKAYTKDGKQYGVIELRIEAPLLEVKGDKVPMKLRAGSKATIDLTVDTNIDGSESAADAKLRTTAELAMPGQGEGEVRVHLEGTEEISAQPLK